MHDGVRWFQKPGNISTGSKSVSTSYATEIHSPRQKRERVSFLVFQVGECESCFYLLCSIVIYRYKKCRLAYIAVLSYGTTKIEQGAYSHEQGKPCVS